MEPKKESKGGYRHGIPKEQQKLKRIPIDIEPLVDELIQQYKKQHGLNQSRQFHI